MSEQSRETVPSHQPPKTTGRMSGKDAAKMPVDRLDDGRNDEDIVADPFFFESLKNLVEEKKKNGYAKRPGDVVGSTERARVPEQPRGMTRVGLPPIPERVTAKIGLVSAEKSARSLIDYHVRRSADMSREDAVTDALAESMEELFAAESDLAKRPDDAGLAEEVAALRQQTRVISTELGEDPPWATGTSFIGSVKSNDAAEDLSAYLNRALERSDAIVQSLRLTAGSCSISAAEWDRARVEHRVRKTRALRAADAALKLDSPLRTQMTQYWRFRAKVEGNAEYALEQVIQDEPERMRAFEELFAAAERSGAGPAALARLARERDAGFSVQHTYDRIASGKFDGIGESDRSALAIALRSVSPERAGGEDGRDADSDVQQLDDRFIADAAARSPGDWKTGATAVPEETDPTQVSAFVSGRPQSVSVTPTLTPEITATELAAERPGFMQRLASSRAGKWLMRGALALGLFKGAAELRDRSHEAPAPARDVAAISVSYREDADAAPAPLPEAVVTPAGDEMEVEAETAEPSPKPAPKADSADRIYPKGDPRNLQRALKILKDSGLPGRADAAKERLDNMRSALAILEESGLPTKAEYQKMKLQERKEEMQAAMGRIEALREIGKMATSPVLTEMKRAELRSKLEQHQAFVEAMNNLKQIQ